MTTTITSQKIKSLNLDLPTDYFTIPVSVYRKTFHNLMFGEISNLILSTKGEDGKCYWIFSAYAKNKENKVNTVFSEILMDCEKLNEIKKLYQKLNKIEKTISIAAAEKYLEGYLEYKNSTLNDFVSYYSLTA